PQIHAARVVTKRAVDELLDFGELENLRNLTLGLVARDAEDRGVHQDVVARREIGIEAGAELEQRHHASDANDAAGRRHDHSRENLEERRLAGAVGTDDAKNGARLDAKGNVAQGPEVAAARFRLAAAERRAQPLPERSRSLSFRFTFERVSLSEAVDNQTIHVVRMGRS